MGTLVLAYFSWKVYTAVTRLFLEIQFLEQNYDIVKCNIWMRQVAEIQNKVFEDNRVEGKKSNVPWILYRLL